jgi:hypothetical protein
MHQSNPRTHSTQIPVVEIHAVNRVLHEGEDVFHPSPHFGLPLIGRLLPFLRRLVPIPFLMNPDRDSHLAIVFLQ